MGPAKKKQKLVDGTAISQPDQNTETAPSPRDDEVPTETAQHSEENAAQQRRSLFVRSLPANTTTESLTELFSASYPVKHATAVTDPETKQCRGYGFVTFADAEDAARAKEELSGHVIDGKRIRVEIAEPRQRDGDGPKRSKFEKEPAQPPKLIVRNLPWSIKRPEQLGKLFLSYGKVKHVTLPSKAPGLMSGFGFVIMRGQKNAQKAIDGVNGKEVDGRTLAVDWAVDKKVFEDTSAGAVQDETAANESESESVVFPPESEDDEMSEDIDDSGLDAEEEEPDLEEDESEDGPNADEHSTEDKSSTLFVRNLPFTCTDEDLDDHFGQFGSTRYARVVMDQGTERSKGTGFVCYYKQEDAEACLRNAPRRATTIASEKDGKAILPSHSILQNEDSDPSGQYTMDGRVLQISRAVQKSEANRLTQEGVAHRNSRDQDKRKLYLLSEGTISSKSKLWEKLSKSEKDMRDASAKQRRKLIESNPSLHLSLTRLSIRNIPRSVNSKELKALARDAIVGFASDVKAGTRERLSKEELARGGGDMHAAELQRKQAGKGVVKQAKVVFEGASGSKVREDSGAGRSRGYGFIEYHTHRNALMGLRWLNGHAVGQRTDGDAQSSREDAQDRKRRLIVEFAIENAQVVLRRQEREKKARDRSSTAKQVETNSVDGSQAKAKGAKSNLGKRTRSSADAVHPRGSKSNGWSTNAKDVPKDAANDKVAKRNQIIGRKRAMRRARQSGKS